MIAPPETQRTRSLGDGIGGTAFGLLDFPKPPCSLCLCGNFLPSSAPSPYLRALLLTGGAADGGEMHHFFFGRLGPGKFAAQSAVTHDQDAICQGQHFWKIT